MTWWASLVGSAMIAIGCGGAPKGGARSPSAGTPSAGAVDAADSGSVVASGDAGAAASVATNPGDPAASVSAAPAPPTHPFAKNGAEATSLIDDAITSRSNELGECVEAARTRRKSPHAKLVLEVGIDEEGHMLGVKLPKGETPDKTLVDCVLAALRGAPFPKSHAGVITVRKTFEDKQVYR
jgi:hypothetical protein